MKKFFNSSFMLFLVSMLAIFIGIQIYPTNTNKEIDKEVYQLMIKNLNHDIQEAKQAKQAKQGTWLNV